MCFFWERNLLPSTKVRSRRWLDHISDPWRWRSKTNIPLVVDGEVKWMRILFHDVPFHVQVPDEKYT